ncbi:hypothetical protein FHX40_1621 [Thermopolyspora flexuosa]|jgi:hypothetical protein|uniref:Uncharacterized protein n=1 Tax=Thermopolyspora flexuosa TaxID=103836 RepID=A0A543IWI6_9ACTN|nr:hypothetical protein FHX40_1621 [Thermopolyspora flexuosa]
MSGPAWPRLDPTVAVARLFPAGSGRPGRGSGTGGGEGRSVAWAWSCAGPCVGSLVGGREGTGRPPWCGDGEAWTWALRHRGTLPRSRRADPAGLRAPWSHRIVAPGDACGIARRCVGPGGVCRAEKGVRGMERGGCAGGGVTLWMGWVNSGEMDALCRMRGGGSPSKTVTNHAICDHAVSPSPRRRSRAVANRTGDLDSRARRVATDDGGMGATTRITGPRPDAHPEGRRPSARALSCCFLLCRRLVGHLRAVPVAAVPSGGRARPPARGRASVIPPVRPDQ